MHTLRLLMVACILVGSSSDAAAATLDFEDLLGSSSSDIFGPGSKTFESHGFIFTFTAFPLGGSYQVLDDCSCVGNGTAVYYQSFFSQLRMEREDGGTFSLLQLDAANPYSLADDDAELFLVAAGNIFTAGAGVPGMQTFQFDDAAKNITTATFHGSDGILSHFALDNIEYDVAPVPLPAAAWLLLSGAGGLFAAAKRSRAV
jgi:hypothetical protein